MILNEHLLCFCFKESILFYSVGVVLVYYLMSVKKNLLKRYIHSDILSTSLDAQHKLVGVMGVMDAAKALEFISYFWSLRLSQSSPPCSVHKT